MTIRLRATMNQTYKFILFCLIAIFFVTAPARGDSGFRRYAGEFMAIDVSARAQAMGGAYSSLANDVFAAFYNPAGMVQIQSTQIGFTHTQQFIASVNYDYIGFTKPLSRDKAFGISLIRLGVDNIPDSRKAGILADDGTLLGIDESQVNNFNSSDYVLFFSLGQRFRSKFLWGFNVKLVRRNLADHSANGIGFDAGVLFNVSDRWRVGGMFRNITTTLIAWDTGEKELVSPTIRMGSSYRVPLPGLNSYLIPNVDLVINTDSPVNLVNDRSATLNGAIGGELVVKERLFIRGGYDDLQRVNFGVGIKIPHINVDYSFTSFDQELGNAHRIGLVIDFQK